MKHCLFKADAGVCICTHEACLWTLLHKLQKSVISGLCHTPTQIPSNVEAAISSDGIRCLSACAGLLVLLEDEQMISAVSHHSFFLFFFFPFAWFVSCSHLALHFLTFSLLKSEGLSAWKSCLFVWYWILCHHTVTRVLKCNEGRLSDYYLFTPRFFTVQLLTDLQLCGFSHNNYHNLNSISFIDEPFSWRKTK